MGTTLTSTTREIKRAADFLPEAQRTKLYEDLAELAKHRAEMHRIHLWWAECGRKACERGSHDSGTSSRNGGPCRRCGVHVPYDALDWLL